MLVQLPIQKWWISHSKNDTFAVEYACKTCNETECVDLPLDFCVENDDCQIVYQNPTCAGKPGFNGLPYRYCRSSLLVTEPNRMYIGKL